METGVRVLVITSVLFSFFLLSLAKNSTISIESLDSTIRDHAFRVLTGRRTGAAYKVPLPPNLAGITASAERIRSGNLWTNGANFSSINIPPKTTTTAPFVRRLVIVYQDLGNWSSSYFNMPGFSLVAPVVGFLAYDASDNSSSNSTRELDFRVLGDPISITFPECALPRELNSTIRCARLGPQGSAVQLTGLSPENKHVCSATITGHFTLVVAPSVAPAAAEEETRWRSWVVAWGSGVGGLAMVGLVGLGIFRLVVRNKRMVEMERHGEEGETLNTSSAGRSKMPSAAMMRTEPVIEDATAAP